MLSIPLRCAPKLVMKLVLLIALIITSNFWAFWLRFDGDIPEWAIQLFVNSLPILVLARLATFIPFKLDRRVWGYTSFGDLGNLCGAVLISTLVFAVVVQFDSNQANYPNSVFLIDTLLLIVVIGAVTVARRVGFTSSARMKRVLIYGAGGAGERLARELRENPSFGYRTVGFVDDDHRKTGQWIHGVKVLGPRRDLPDIMSSVAPELVLIAMPSIEGGAKREIAKALLDYKVSIRILPDLSDLLDGKLEVDQLRNLSVEDLLRRPPVTLDRSSTAALLKGKRILVTGAGGSIGSELCRQIVSYGPEALILYERYENNLFAIHGELTHRPPPVAVYPVVGDVTDRTRLESAMEAYAPEIVFHAAAHKHVPLMEFNPCEAVKNNVTGTRTIAELADQMHVERFVMISTDKAVRPSSVMGATKRIAELIIQDIARTSRTAFTTVRFGNVLGSNGSVVPHFLQQIKSGGPVTVTDPEVQRFFMLIPEAVELVLQAVSLADKGSTYVLEMGKQIKLQDLARHLIRLSGFVPDQDIAITFTGLRPGEKLAEELIGPDETAMPSQLKEILKVSQKHIPDHDWLALTVSQLESMAYLQNADEVLAGIKLLVPTFESATRDSVLAIERSLRVPEYGNGFVKPTSRGGSDEGIDVTRGGRSHDHRVRWNVGSGTVAAPAASVPDRSE